MADKPETEHFAGIPCTPAPQTRPERDFGVATLRVGILLWPSFPLMSLTCIVESLRHVGDHGDASQPRYARWDILGAAGSRAVSSCGIPVEATAVYSDPSAFDFVVVVGGLLRDLNAAPAKHRSFLRAAIRADTVVVGACTGVFALAQEGLLSGNPVCVHPYHERDFANAFPHHRLILNQDYVLSGRIITVLGGVSMLSLMSHIIGQHFGPDRAAKLVHQMTLPAVEPIETQDWKAMLRGVAITDHRIQTALTTLDAQAKQNPSIAQLARSVGLSERHFLRIFRKQVGRSPKQYLIDMKLHIAVWMLRRTTSSITSIAYAAGFSSGANLADHCKKRFGATPNQIRHDPGAARPQATART